MENRYLSSNDLRIDQYVVVKFISNEKFPLEKKEHFYIVRFIHDDELFVWLQAKCKELKTYMVSTTYTTPFLFGEIKNGKVVFNDKEIDIDPLWKSGNKPAIPRYLVDPNVINLVK